MKKSFLFMLLATLTANVMAQKKTPFLADSLLNNKLTYKMDTGLFSNKGLINKLSQGNTLTYSLPNKLQPFPLAIANNVDRVTYSKVDHMPILNTSGKAKTPIIKPQGNSKMPVIGKGSDENDVVIIDRRP